MAVIIAIVFLAACVVCATKESKLTGTYKALNVYGRLTAYLALDFLMVGIMGILSPILAIFDVQFVDGGPIVGFLLGAVMLALAVLLYFRAYQKCPDFMKKKCIPSMIVSGLGVAIKICIFFLGFVWKLTGPQTMVTDNGEEVYVFSDGTVYGSGKTGKVVNGNTVVWNS